METQNDNPWISVYDRMPGMDDEIFVTFAYDHDGISKRGYTWLRGYLLIEDRKSDDPVYDYWMPTPVVPSEDGNNKTENNNERTTLLSRTGTTVPVVPDFLGTIVRWVRNLFLDKRQNK